ncbi:MAG: hypothetical protein VB878_25500, partial [Pirellulaceae bacterium]
MTAPTPETKASEEQKRPRFRTVLIVVLTIATAGAAAWMLNRSAGRLSLVEQPEVDLASSSRAVVQTIQQAQTRVDSSPDDAIAWGELGMVLFAHQFEAEARACFEQAERLDPQEFRWPYLHGVCALCTLPPIVIALVSPPGSGAPACGKGRPGGCCPTALAARAASAPPPAAAASGPAAPSSSS